MIENSKPSSRHQSKEKEALLEKYTTIADEVRTMTQRLASFADSADVDDPMLEALLGSRLFDLHTSSLKSLQDSKAMLVEMGIWQEIER